MEVPSVTCAQASSRHSYTYHHTLPTAISPQVPCILGVDEAGRGPVIGPMVYACAYCPEQHADERLKEEGFADSKTLTPADRVSLLKRMIGNGIGNGREEYIGWSVRVMSAHDISSAMLSPAGYNLNAQAHDATIELIRDVVRQGVNVTQIFVDTVGVAMSYQDKLQRLFPQATVTVTKKADSLFPIVSAASIAAKVTRDAALAGQQQEGDDGDWGSGYPSDPRAVEWLDKHISPVFGWKSDMVRFSWQTVLTKLEKDKASLRVDWHDADAESNLHSFLGPKGAATAHRGLCDHYGSLVLASAF